MIRPLDRNPHSRQPIRWLTAASIAALFAVVAEMGFIGIATVGVLWATATCFLGLALITGLSLDLAQAGANKIAGESSRSRRRIWAAAFAVATPTLPLAWWVGAEMFEGAFASTLPGADAAWLWFPLLAWTGVATALAIGHASPRWFRVLGVLVAMVGVEWLNRSVKVDELFRLHTALLIATFIGAAFILRSLAPRGRPAPAPAYVVAATLVYASVIPGLRHGLSDRFDRWVVAHNGAHARLLTRSARELFDFDGDGFAFAFGGADCDELDSTLR